jgi:hypothetical protein
MTKEEKAREIIRQNGECNGFMCDSGGENKCPCWDICISGEDDPEIRVKNCKEFLDELKECLPDGVYENGNLVNKIPVKTLLDEFAIAALMGILENDDFERYRQIMLDGVVSDEKQTDALVSVCYDYAAAMMAERARRGEMGNVKEPS